jgi:hypothetical protein
VAPSSGREAWSEAGVLKSLPSSLFLPRRARGLSGATPRWLDRWQKFEHRLETRTSCQGGSLPRLAGKQIKVDGSAGDLLGQVKSS